MNDLRIYQIALSQLQGIGPRKAIKLVSIGAEIERIFHDSIPQLSRKTGIRESILAQMKREEAIERARLEVAFMEKNGIRVHYFLDDDYPRRLKQSSDAPIVLFSYGNVEMNPKRTVSVVGTRKATPYGFALCQEFIQGVKDAEVQVISGLAYGIDICAHLACVQQGTPTVAVLGHGLDRIYPSAHRKIANKMLDNGGWISEYLTGVTPEREHFPMRNRIVAGMSDAIVVVESKANGGSLITASLGNDYQKDVFAFPGNVGQPQSEGCNQLIRENAAHLVTGSADFLKQMCWDQAPAKNKNLIDLNLDENQKCVIGLIEDHPRIHIDALAIRSNLSIQQINQVLIELELQQIISSYPGNYYQRA
jgi:DNA processing protein